MVDLGPLVPFLVGGGVIAVAILVGVWSWQADKKRREALAALADKLGYAFVVDGLDLGPLRSLHLFSQGRSHHNANALRGQEAEVGVNLFDYSYVTGSGKNRRTTHHTVVWLVWPALKLPEFSLRPEHVFHKLGSLLGYQDIDFPHHPDFSGKYLLRGKAEAAVRQIFNPVVIDFFERRTGVSAEGCGQNLVLYRGSRHLPVEEVQNLIHEALDLVHRLPRSG